MNFDRIEMSKPMQTNRLIQAKPAQWLTSLLLAFALLLGSTVQAQTEPEEVLRASVDSLISEFSAQRDELAADKKKLYALAEDLLDNSWDFAKMSQLVLGKNWKKATDTQKTEFTQAFKDLLIRTYSSAMFKYTGKESITFNGTDYKGSKKNRAVVNGLGDLGDGSEPIPLAFSVYQDDAENWRIYNIGIAGVSLVTTYRASYNQIIRSKGLDSLIASLKEKAAEQG